MGWAAGVERILLAGDAQPSGSSPVELFVALHGERAQRAAFGLLEAARSAGLRAQMELAGRSLKGQLGQADALGARYVAIVEDGETVLKDMQDGGQERIATDTVVHAVLRGLRTL
jgi:histidyl-tRNA synthetase